MVMSKTATAGGLKRAVKLGKNSNDKSITETLHQANR